MKLEEKNEQLIVEQELQQEQSTENEQTPKSLSTSIFNSTDNEYDEQENFEDEKEENDENDENEEDEKDKKNKKQKQYIIPSSYIDLLSMSKRILEVWKTKPELVLIWMPIEVFENLLENFERAGDDKSDKKTKRSPVVSLLKELDKEIDFNLTYLKQQISIKFGKQHRESYYADFGIVYCQKNYSLPKDRQDRIKTLQKMVTSLEHYQMTDIEYGLNYWKDIKDRYEQLLNQNIELTQNISSEAGKKSELKKQIKETIVAMQNLIKVQYREQAHFVLREFGYLREHF